MPKNRKISISIASTFSLWKTGAFDVASYLSSNPDLPPSNIFALWHYVRFSEHENRNTGQPAEMEWLFSKLTRRELSYRQIKQLSQVVLDKDTGDATPRLKRLFKEMNLPWPIFMAYRALSSFDRAQIAASLHDITGDEFTEDALMLHYKATRFIGLTFGAKNVVNNALNLLCQKQSLPLQYYMALFHLSQALGIYTYKDKSILSIIIHHMHKTGYTPVTSLREDLWTLGIYMGTPDVWQDLNLPELYKTKLVESPTLYNASMEGWECILSAAAKNALCNKPTFIHLHEDAEWEYGHGNSKNVYTLRVMPRQYWVEPQFNPAFSDYLLAFKTLCKKTAREKNCSFFAIPSGPIYDLTYFQPPYSPTISYHTYKLSQKPSHDIYFKESSLMGYFTQDRYGFSGWAQPNMKTKPSPEVMETFFNNLRDQIIGRQLTKYDQKHCQSAPIATNVLFIPLQIPNDVVVQLSRVDIFQAIEYLLKDKELLKKSGFDHIVIKKHPNRLLKKSVFGLFLVD